jgi:hypothetical protein
MTYARTTTVLENWVCFLEIKIRIMIMEKDSVALFNKILASSQKGYLFV